MKTIFIIISQGHLIRNILRSGGFREFKKGGYRLFIFLQCEKDEIPHYLLREFNDPSITFIPLSANKFLMSRFYRFFIICASYFFWNKTTRRHFQYTPNYIHTHRITKMFRLTMLRIVSATIGKIKFLRLGMRLIDTKFFPENFSFVREYFEKYKADLVFSTSITSRVDVAFMKEARRRSIPTVSMSKDWDTPPRIYYHFVPDYFLAQNKLIKQALVNLQDFPEEKIYTIGFPGFDWYTRKDIIRSRQEHFKRFNLDPNLPLLFFGSQGVWLDGDYRIADRIYELIEESALVKECQLLVRPHPYFFNKGFNPFLKFKKLKHASYDGSFSHMVSFPGSYEMSSEEMIDYINTLYHADIVVVPLSTLALEAAYFDKPIINAPFDCLFLNGKDITPRMASSEHYGWIFDTKGTSIAWSKEELGKNINMYLRDPQFKSKERHFLRDRLCYKTDGRSSIRMVEAINHILRK